MSLRYACRSHGKERGGGGGGGGGGRGGGRVCVCTVNVRACISVHGYVCV